MKQPTFRALPTGRHMHCTMATLIVPTLSVLYKPIDHQKKAAYQKAKYENEKRANQGARKPIPGADRADSRTQDKTYKYRNSLNQIVLQSNVRTRDRVRDKV